MLNITEHQLLTFARKLEQNTWYTREDLAKAWKVDTSTRSVIRARFRRRNMIHTKGDTTKTEYQLRPEKDWKIKDWKIKGFKPIKKTGNGVIDAKLRKEAKLPEVPSALEALITSATTLGSENEILKQAVRDIDTIINKIREHL